MLGTVTKAGKVLDLFTVAHPEWGVAEVAARLSIPKSSAHGLLASLCEIGLMRRATGGRYRLGWRIVELNRTLSDTTGLLAGTRPVLRQLSEHLGAMAELGALHHDEVTVLDRAVSASATETMRRVASTPAVVGRSALSKVLVANMRSGDRDKLIERLCCPGTNPLPPSAPADLQTELGAVRLRGIGYDIEQTQVGSCSVAAPVWDADGEVHAAIAVTLPSLPFHRNRELLSRSVQRAAARLSQNARSEPRECVLSGTTGPRISVPT
ncbi:IclR family transcriptional regulator [Nocardioides sp. NPDC051685]|uniref:IclR family transcriptional regulator n=1 Tax=Nocardioides sp. NPDC051685 TaxID=3364334 RepID=UPI0037A9BB43